MPTTNNQQTGMAAVRQAAIDAGILPGTPTRQQNAVFAPALKMYAGVIKEIQTVETGNAMFLEISWLLNDNAKLFTASSRFCVFNHGSEIKAMKAIAEKILKTKITTVANLQHTVSNVSENVLSVIFGCELGMPVYNARSGNKRYQIVKAFPHKKDNQPATMAEADRQKLFNHWSKNPLSVTI